MAHQGSLEELDRKEKLAAQAQQEVTVQMETMVLMVNAVQLDHKEML